MTDDAADTETQQPDAEAVHRSRQSLTINTTRQTKAERREVLAEIEAFPWEEYPRPRTRGDCLEGGSNAERPCPFVSCRYHLYVDVSPPTGHLVLNFPGLDVDQIPETCVLDVADRGSNTPLAIGDVLHVSRERVRQLESKALRRVRLRGGASLKELEPFLAEELLDANRAAMAAEHSAKGCVMGTETAQSDQPTQTPVEPSGEPSIIEKPAEPKICPWHGCEDSSGSVRSVTELPDPRLADFCGKHRNKIRMGKAYAEEYGFDWTVVRFASLAPHSPRAMPVVAPNPRPAPAQTQRPVSPAAAPVPVPAAPPPTAAEQPRRHGGEMTLLTSTWVISALDALALSGRFGATPSQVAEELLREKLREIEKEGYLSRT